MKAQLRLLSGAIALLTAPLVLAETDWLDVDLYPSGALAPVAAVRVRRGEEWHWERAKVQVSIGLERLRNAPWCKAGDECQGLDGYQMAVDLAAAAKSLPVGCGLKLAVPWKILRRSFPPKESFPPDQWAPKPYHRPDDWPAQELSWRQGDCQITAVFAYPIVKSRTPPGAQPPSSMRGLDRRWFRGGDFQEITLKLMGKDKTSQYVLAIPFRIIR